MVLQIVQDCTTYQTIRENYFTKGFKNENILLLIQDKSTVDGLKQILQNLLAERQKIINQKSKPVTLYPVTKGTCYQRLSFSFISLILTNIILTTPNCQATVPSAHLLRQMPSGGTAHNCIILSGLLIMNWYFK